MPPARPKTGSAVVDSVRVVFSCWMLVLMALHVVETHSSGLGLQSDGPYGGARCSSKLDTTLQQMFKRIGTRIVAPKTSTYSLDDHPPPVSPYSSDRRRRRQFDDPRADPAASTWERRRPGHNQYDFDAYDRYGGPQIADVDHNESPAASAHHLNDPIDYDEDDERAAGAGHELGGRIHVAELRVRLPPGAGSGGSGGPWVRVEKCQFQPANRTLDTRLTFPDLTISGRVQFQSRSGAPQRPGAGCSMILRLRQAGIEFRTIPLVEQRSRTATVRTDSYFADPGFISVFAHGCDSLMSAAVTGRPNSKRRKHFGGEIRQEPTAAASSDTSAAERRHLASGVSVVHKDMDRGDVADTFHFDGDILGYANGGLGGGGGDWISAPPQDRTWPSSGGGSGGGGNNRYPSAGWQNVELSESADEAYTRELEELFSKGVRGLLTTYMQRALQPAIKETLMESMGYRLSYG